MAEYGVRECDICHRTSGVTYLMKKKFKLFRRRTKYYYDGLTHQAYEVKNRLDFCDDCFKKIGQLVNGDKQ
jgi:hypothetical protein